MPLSLLFEHSLLLQYHGGTNFGRTAGGPFITTSYDYDAPIDEYGECMLNFNFQKERSKHMPSLVFYIHLLYVIFGF